MDSNEAIKRLQSIKQAKKQGEENNQSNIFARSLMNFKNIIVGAMSDLTGLLLSNEPKVTVKNFPKTTTLDNKVLKVEVTNHPKKESIEKVEVINQPEINFSTTSLEAKISKIELGLEKIAPMMRTSSTEALVKSSKLIDEVKQLQDVIRKIKLDPQITVKPADVKVDTPIVNVPATKIPPFPKTIKTDIDLSAIEDKLEELLTEIQYASTKPVVVANPGDFPVSTTNTRDLAKEAKQLPDNHNVNVSNIDDVPLITGFATETKQDTIITHLPLNEVGRIKTSNLPADITPVTGTITANAQTIPVPTDRVSNVMAHCYGTFSTVNCTFEGSLNSTNGTDGNWFTIQAVRTNANTVETTTGNLSAAPAYGWELSVNALKYMRVRATAFTSGTQSWVFSLGSYATEPIPAIQTHAVTVGAATTNIAKAEDSASASANVGVPPMVVRADTLQTAAGVSANGDYAFMFCDVDGRVYTNSMITGKTSDTTYQTPRIDTSTHTLQTIDYPHHEIHDGSYFRAGMNYSLANGEVATFAITTPNTTSWLHITWELSATADGTFALLEDVTSFAGGAAVTPLNHNRNAGTASTATCLRGMTGADLITPTGGTQILGATLGTGKGSSVERDTSGEFILKQNSKYLFRYTNGTSANIIQLACEWYEHTNKTA